MTKPTKKPRAKRLSQVEKDNARVPRDWANDPVWLRDLLRRTWDALGDDMDTVFRIGDEAGLTHDEFDLLSGQVGYVLSEYETESGGLGTDLVCRAAGDE